MNQDAKKQLPSPDSSGAKCLEIGDTATTVTTHGSTTTITEGNVTASFKRNPSDFLNLDLFSSFLIVVIGSIILYLIVQQEPFIMNSQDVLNVAIMWTSSMGAAYAFASLGIPALLGSLVVGAILQNGVAGFHISSRFREIIEGCGLCVILLISSMELDINAVAKIGGASLRLTLIPGLVEAAVCSLIAYWLFEMPPALSLSLGFMLAAVSPAVVVPGMMVLTKQGLGVDKGIPSLIMAACSLDDIVAITGFTIAIGIALDTTDNTALMSAFIHGPVAIFVGVVSGCIGGVILAAARSCPSQGQQTIICLELGLLMTFGFKSAGFDGSGAIGTLVMGIFAKQVSQHSAEYLQKIEIDINTLWEVCIRPLLFGIVGTSFDLNRLPKESVLRGLSVVLVGLFFRLPAAYFSAFGAGLTAKERMFVASSWSPKATVQAALCSLPLTMIKKRYDTESVNYLEMISWAEQIVSTAVLAIAITAPIGALSIQFLGPKLLPKNDTKEVAETQCPTQ